jgi:hypothetical protein
MLPGLASLANAYWVHLAKLLHFLASRALPSHVISGSIKMALAYHKLILFL